MPSKYLIRYITLCMHMVMYCIWTSLIIPCQKEFNMFSKLFRPVEWISCHLKNENNIKWLWKTYGKTSLSVHLWYRFWFTKVPNFCNGWIKVHFTMSTLYLEEWHWDCLWCPFGKGIYLLGRYSRQCCAWHMFCYIHITKINLNMHVSLQSFC